MVTLSEIRAVPRIAKINGSDNPEARSKSHKTIPPTWVFIPGAFMEQLSNLCSTVHV
jgi:hypothetical protein